ncbi:MAG: hypothetical protein QF738_03575 [Rhodospirillales bacterium]|nr:hypothetical protein [Rhodospirillales bacterium]
MDFLIIALVAVVAVIYFANKFEGDPTTKSNDQLVREYTVYLNRQNRRIRMTRMPIAAGQPQPSSAAAELRRRGIDPDKAIDEKFDARAESRPMRWEACALHGFEGARLSGAARGTQDGAGLSGAERGTQDAAGPTDD